VGRCWVLREASGYLSCCPGGHGEAGGAAGRSWMMRKEGRALWAEGVPVDVG
jgi:hypothetical protein